MNTLIVYRTNHGCVEKCANMLAQKLNGNAEIQNMKSMVDLDLSGYDRIIIGGSIYAGRIQKEISEFCTKNIDILKQKKIGLFICGMQNEAFQAELNAAYPKELLDNSIAKDCFGGEFVFKSMNFMERMIVKMIAKTDKDVSNISEAAIDSFAKQMLSA